MAAVRARGPEGDLDNNRMRIHLSCSGSISVKTLVQSMRRKKNCVLEKAEVCEYAHNAEVWRSARKRLRLHRVSTSTIL